MFVATPSPVPVTTTVLSTGSLTIQRTSPFTSSPGKGQIQVAFEKVGGAVSGQCVTVSRSATDVLGKPIKGDYVDSSCTDSSGTVRFDVSPSAYVLTSSLSGYNWGDLQGQQGQAGLAIGEQQLLLVRVRLGALTTTAASVDRARSGQCFTVRFQKRDVLGRFVSGDYVDSACTGNSGASTFNLTPGHYEVTSSFRGYNWGDLADASGAADVSVQAGQEGRVNLRPGRIQVIAASGVWPTVRTQKQDASGQPIGDAYVESGCADNSGSWYTDVVPGVYVVQVSGRTVANVTVAASQTTVVR